MPITNQQFIASFYAAFYNRAPDKAGLTYWENKASEDSFNEIASGFAAHPQFAALYNHLSHQQFVEAIYFNVLGFDGDASGIAYWSNEISNGTSRPQMVYAFIFSALNDNLEDAKWDSLTPEEKTIAQHRQDTLLNKISAALAFVENFGDASNISDTADLENDPAYLASIVALSGINETAASIATASARLSLPDDIIVIDDDTTAPVFTSRPSASAIDENSGSGQVVYTAAANDENTITYSIKDDSDGYKFTINPTTGAVTLNSNPNFESKSSYSFTIVATDEAGNQSEKAIGLQVNDLADTDVTAPTITVAPTRASDTTISLTTNEAATAGIYQTPGTLSGLIGSTVALDGTNPANITVAQQTPTPLTGTIVVVDAVGNKTVSKLVSLGTSAADTYSPTAATEMIFGFAGIDTFNAGASLVATTTFDGGAGADVLNLSDDNAVTDLDNIFNVETINITNTNASVYTLSGNTLIANGAALTVNALAAQNVSLDISANTTTGALTYVGNSGVDTISGGSGADTLAGGAGNDIIEGNTGADSITGGLGADQISVGSAAGDVDTVIVAAGDTVLTIGGAGDTGTIAGFDTVTNFHDADGVNLSDALDVQGAASIAADGPIDGTDSTLTIAASAIASHSVTNGVVTFDDANIFASALTIATNSELAAVIEYLQANDLGNAGISFAFDVVNDTYVYTQGSDAGTDNTLDTLVQLSGVQADAIILVNGTGVDDLFLM